MSDLHPGIATANPDAYRINDHEDYDSGRIILPQICHQVSLPLPGAGFFASLGETGSSAHR